MLYELGFIGIPQASGDADTVCMRFYNEQLQRFAVGAYDGGIKQYGKALVKHMRQYYFPESPKGVKPQVDFVICSHPDMDHVSGLCELFDHFQVKALYANRPWLYIDEIFDNVADNRYKKKNLEDHLREKNSFLDDLEKCALKVGTKIYNCFKGVKICDHLEILSPDKDFYLELLIEYDKAPALADNVLRQDVFPVAKNMLHRTTETWTEELLWENVTTSTENESSIIILGNMEEERFLLTGDAGIYALQHAFNAMKSRGLNPTSINVYQIPHYGGCRNVSPSILNEFVGSIQYENCPPIPNKQTIGSVGGDSGLPHGMVTDDFIRRGIATFKTDGLPIQHLNAYTPICPHEGWCHSPQVTLTTLVDLWEDDV